MVPIPRAKHFDEYQIPKKEILSFIKHFSCYGEQVIDCFLNGNCFWFAKILQRRFPGGCIAYNSSENHFAYSHNGVIYDITGIVADSTDDQKDWHSWKFYRHYDPSHSKRIYRDCIRF